jgi:hypothetical protein
MPKAKPLIALSPLDAAYLAGVIDGEGSIGIYPARLLPRTVHRTYNLQLQITHTHLPLLQWIQARCYGSITKGRSPVVLTPKCAKRPTWHWTTHTRHAANVIRQIQPYLIVKAAEAAVALRYADRVGHHNRIHKKGVTGSVPIGPEEWIAREALANELKQLKRPSGPA